MSHRPSRLVHISTAPPRFPARTSGTAPAWPHRPPLRLSRVGFPLRPQRNGRPCGAPRRRTLTRHSYHQAAENGSCPGNPSRQNKAGLTHVVPIILRDHFIPRCLFEVDRVTRVSVILLRHFDSQALGLGLGLRANDFVSSRRRLATQPHLVPTEAAMRPGLAPGRHCLNARLSCGNTR